MKSRKKYFNLILLISLILVVVLDHMFWMNRAKAPEKLADAQSEWQYTCQELQNGNPIAYVLLGMNVLACALIVYRIFYMINDHKKKR